MPRSVKDHIFGMQGYSYVVFGGEVISTGYLIESKAMTSTGKYVNLTGHLLDG